jgi:protein-S-isoprenylcysteine O-methyltransferase Ste14
MGFLLAFIFTYRGALAPLALAPAMILPCEPESRLYYVLGFCTLLLGILFRIAGVRRIGGRARVHSAGVKSLATSGIYGRVRNPLYVGNLLYAAGIVGLFGSLWGGIMAGFYLFVLYTAIAIHEEKVLEQQIGASYREYRLAVPRWRILLRPYRDPDASSSVTPVGEIMRREMYFLLAGVLVALLATCVQFGFFSYSSSGVPFPPEYRTIGGTGLVLLLSLVLFFSVGRKLKRKRGGWLNVN